jgi:hypothetical protein
MVDNMQDREEGTPDLRTDQWLSNEEELRLERTSGVYPNEFDESTVSGPYTLDPWDPDSDDDGLTDGQEVAGLTLAHEERTYRESYGPGFRREDADITLDTEHTYFTDPTDPDTDDDGYWDGWIGVYGVNYSDNVILYEENLHTDSDGDGEMGIDDPSNRVDAQVGVHNVTDRAPAGLSADIDDDGTQEHSNVHIGELHWRSNGADGDPRSSTTTPDPTLAVEVDNIVNSSWADNGSINNIENDNNVSLDTAVERNYALYGVDVRLVQDDNLTRSEIEANTGREPNTGIYPAPGEPSVTPDGLNRWELIRVETLAHDNESRLHLLWGTRLENDSPKTPIDILSPYGGATGLAWHVGAPDSPDVALVEGDFGVMVARDNFHTDQYQDLQSVTMHELGHALSIGWADDAPIPIASVISGEQAYEVYSGSDNSNLAGGVDETPENVAINGPPIADWSVMARGTGEDAGIGTETPRLVFSIEEVSTVDLNHIPSKND